MVRRRIRWGTLGRTLGLICAWGPGVAMMDDGLLAATTGSNAGSGALAATADSGGVAAADSVHKYRFLAKASRQQKDLDKALGHYLQLLRYAPDDLKANYFSGTIYLAKKRNPEAKRAFLHVIQLDSLHRNSNSALAQLFLGEGKADSAWRSLGRLLRAKPGVAKYREYRRKLADLYRKGGDSDRAIEHYTALTAGSVAGGELADLYDVLARLRENRGEARSALDWRLRLAALQEKSAVIAGEGQSAARRQHCETLDQIVDLQVALADFQIACETLRQLVSLDTGNSYSHYRRMTELAEKSGDQSMELEGLEGMAHADPQDLETLYVLVEFHMSGDDLPAAFAWLDKGLGVRPDDSHLHLLKGDLHVRRGEEDLAIAAYETARTDPVWEAVAQQRIWQLRPPETREEKLKREFFGSGGTDEVSQATDGS